jgi:hypothetical protein
MNGKIVYQSDMHSHAADTTNAGAATVVRSMLNIVATSHNSTCIIIRDELANIDESTATSLPNRRTLSRWIQRTLHRQYKHKISGHDNPLK